MHQKHLTQFKQLLRAYAEAPSKGTEYALNHFARTLDTRDQITLVRWVEPLKAEAEKRAAIRDIRSITQRARA